MVAWRSNEVDWGNTLCHRKGCVKAAELLFDGEPLCIDDAEDLLDRIAAVEAAPILRELLPELGDC